MLKASSYFLVAVLLVGGTKLIQVYFYEYLKTPHAEEKAHSAKKSNEADPGHGQTQLSAEYEEADKPAEEQADTVTLITEVPAELDEKAADADVQTNNVEPEPAEEIETPVNNDVSYFDDIKNSYISPILAELPEGRSREDVVVRYYKHENDGQEIYSLRKLGYYLHEREAEDNLRLRSNSLYYGDDVDIRDIRLVAYELIKAGVPLKSISRSQFDWKFNSIEIGADSLVENNSILSISDILAFEK